LYIAPPATAEAIAKEITSFNAKMLEQGDGVVCHVLIAQGAINVGGVSMALLLDGNDLTALSKDRYHLAEIGFDGRKSAVQ
jgi:hypothetical protein